MLDTGISPNRLNGTLFLSPHSDDIAISSTYAILSKVFPQPLHLVTVFSLSSWVSPSYANNLEKKVISKIRVMEDRKFCSALNITYHELPFEDCLLRHGDVIYDLSYTDNACLLKSVCNYIYSIILSTNINLICVPHPHGHLKHVDHVILHNVATLIATKHNISTIYLDDLPYSRLHVSYFDSSSPSFRYRRFELCLDESALDKKSQLVSIYKSQLTPFILDSLRMIAQGDSNNNITESIWIPVQS